MPAANKTACRSTWPFERPALLARASYREGNAGVLLVLDAERSYQQARLGYVRAVVQRYFDTVQLFLALGGTSPSARQ